VKTGDETDPVSARHGLPGGLSRDRIRGLLRL